MTKEDILKIVHNCYSYAWSDYRMTKSGSSDEYIAKTLMKMFNYIEKALKEEQQ